VQESESRVTIGLQPAPRPQPVKSIPRKPGVYRVSVHPLINLCGRRAAGHDRRSQLVEKVHLWAVQRVATLCSGGRADEIEAVFHSAAATPVPAMGNGKRVGPLECTCFETRATGVWSIRKMGVDANAKSPIANRQSRPLHNLA
jgi:hypothetical protein